MRRIFLVILVSVLLYATAVSAANTVKREITFDQAKTLIWAVLPLETLRLPGLTIFHSDKNPEDISSYRSSENPRFAVFNVIWTGTADSSIEVGFYAVDIYTGDVFDSVAGDCVGYNNKRLRVLQRKVRYSLHLTDAQYKKIKTKGPMCVD